MDLLVNIGPAEEELVSSAALPKKVGRPDTPNRVILVRAP